MKKFKFKLQKILEIREHLENEQKLKLVQAASEYQKLILKQDQLFQNIQSTQLQIDQQITSYQIDINSLRYLDQLHNKTSLYKHIMSPEIQLKKEKMEKEQQKYNSLHQKKRAIEILKESALTKYKYSFSKQESSKMDEIAKNIFNQYHNI